MTKDNSELERVVRARKRARLRLIRRRRRYLAAALLLLLVVSVGASVWFRQFNSDREKLDLQYLEAPRWITQDFFNPNPYSRPGTKMEKVDYIVVHYVANKGTSARNNWNYFNDMERQPENQRRSASSHFLIGLEGEILQGIPLNEISYSTSKKYNFSSVSIECCHPDDSGKFNKDTYKSLVRLTAWLCDSLNLDEKAVIRHYDATEKMCPKYYVEHEDEWKKFLKDVKKAL